MMHRLLLLISVTLAWISPAAAQEIVFAVNEGVTYHITPHETRDRYRDLAEAFGKSLRRPVRVVPIDQYPVLRKGLEEKAYDIAFVHPAHHAFRAMRDQRYRLIALTRGFTDYKAHFLLKKDAPLSKPEQIRGRSMVMPDPDSITAWMARATLRDMGMNPQTENLRTTRYQDGIPFMMEHGFYEVGITAASSVVREWQLVGGRVLFESRPVPIKLLIASPDVSRIEYESMQTFFFDLERSEAGRTILAKIGFRGFEAGDTAKIVELTTWLGL